LLPRLLLLAAVLLAFGASVTHGFHFDDQTVVHGPQWGAWQTRPLTWLSFEANFRIGQHPAPWHLVNLAAHFAAVLLLYEWLLLAATPAAALLGALIFAVHPIQAEAVAYVYSRATLFSTAFSLACIVLWLRGRRWASLACYALALLSKEDCVTVPLVILLFELFPTKPPGNERRAGLEPRRTGWIAAMVGLAFLAGLRTLLATRVAGSNAGFTAGISPAQYLSMQGFVIVRDLRLLLVPHGFTIDPQIQASLWLALTCWLLIAVSIVFAAREPWRSRGAIFWLCGFILLIPSSSIFPAADLAADHRMYLPMIGFAACAGILLARLPAIAGAAAIIVLILVSAARMSVWSDDRKLWSEAVERAPDKLRPRIQLARAMDPSQALRILQEAQSRYPDNVDLHDELGRVYLQLGQPAAALGEFGQVLGRHPGDPHAINNRGVALQALGQSAAAREDFERALKLNPCFEEARKNLGLAPCAR
jgi:tetratricopeptide (TPR) repeat protein